MNKLLVGLLSSTIILLVSCNLLFAQGNDSIPNRDELLQKLKQKEKESHKLYSQLLEAVKNEEKILTYMILKEWWGKGTPKEGEEFEKRVKLASEKRRRLNKTKLKLERQLYMDIEQKDWQASVKEVVLETIEQYRNEIAILESDIKELEEEALNHAENTIAEFLPLVFEVMRDPDFGEDENDVS